MSSKSSLKSIEELARAKMPAETSSSVFASAKISSSVAADSPDAWPNLCLKTRKLKSQCSCDSMSIKISNKFHWIITDKTT